MAGTSYGNIYFLVTKHGEYNKRFLNKVIKCQRKRGKFFVHQELESQNDEICCQGRHKHIKTVGDHEV